MANVNNKRNLDPDATGILEETPEQREERLLLDRLDDARRKEMRLEQIKKEEAEKLMESVKEKGSLRRFREAEGPGAWEKLTPSQMQEELGDVEKEATRRAMLRLGEKEAEIIPYSSKFKGSGAQGELILGKLRDIGIDVDNLSEEQVNSKLEEIRRNKEANKPYVSKLTQMQDTGSSRPVFTEAPMVGETPGEYDVDELKRSIGKDKAFRGLKSTLGSGARKLAEKLPAGLGAVTAASALSEGDLPEAALGAAEIGLGAAGRGVSRFVPGLDLLRPTPIASEEEELEKIRFNKLNEYLKKRGLSSEIE